MFASDRFQFDTPNVIDPGDAPPSHPSRSSTNDDHDDNHRYADDDIRTKATRLLSESRKSSFSFVSKSYKDFSFVDEEDDEDGRGSQLPSVEDARMYAVSVLSASAERNHSPIFIRQPAGSSSSEKMSFSLDRTVKLDTPSQRFVRHRIIQRIIICLVIALIVLAIILTGVILGTRSSSSSSPSDQSIRFQETLLILGQETSSTIALYTEGTPQYKAADWIANRDQLQYPIPTQPGADSDRFLQRYVLAVLYFALNGEQWTSAANFLSASDECGWSDITVVELGVTCTTSLLVKGINLSGNNLVGSLPDELQYLYNLQYLSFYDNSITGSIPSSLNTLSLLDHFDLRHNQLMGTLPTWIGQLQSLQVLGLSDNLFTGSIPSGLSSLGKLTTLALDLNEFQGSVDTMGRMTNLQYLYLDSNQFTGRLDQGIFDHLQNLTELTLADNSFEASRFPSAFLSFPKLRNLDLSVNAISGSLPPTIPMNTMLEYLTLSDNNIGGSIPSAIRALVALRQLDLSLNYLSGSIPYSLNGLTNLQYFYLDQNKFKAGPFPQLFGSMTQLNELSLADTGLTGTIPYWIKSLKLLESFDVRKNSLDGVIPSSIWEMTKLQYLLLSTNFLHGTFPAYVPLTNLQIAALHENALTGNASGFCKNNIPILTYDCHKVTCDCCSKELGCCLQGLNGSCYESVKWVQDLGVLEHNYTLTALGF